MNNGWPPPEYPKPPAAFPPPPDNFFAPPNPSNPVAPRPPGEKAPDWLMSPPVSPPCPPSPGLPRPPDEPLKQEDDWFALPKEMSEESEEDDLRKPAAVFSADKKQGDDKKLARLKKQVAKKERKSHQEKRRRASEQASKKPEMGSQQGRQKQSSQGSKVQAKKQGGRKSLIKGNPKKNGPKLKQTLKKFQGMFTDKAERNAEAKINGGKVVGKLGEGDDVMPASQPKKAQEDSDAIDVWIDDPAWLTDKQHRVDLVLVMNHDNNGQLFHEGKRPFWKNKAFLKEIPPPPAEKAVSKLMMQVVRDEIPLADPVLEPEMDYADNLEDLMAKDTKWFKEENVLANTIRSAVVSLDTQTMCPQMVDFGQQRQILIAEPKTAKVYVRMQPGMEREQPFKKTPPPGKPKRLRGKNSNSSSSTSTEK